MENSESDYCVFQRSERFIEQDFRKSVFVVRLLRVETTSTHQTIGAECR